MSTNESHRTDLCVVGAGAAGLVAGGVAARAGVDTLVLEKGRQTGIKILIAGGGHCNLTHDCSVNRMLEGFGPAAAWLRPSMKSFSPRAVRRFFDRLGVPTYVGEWEKVWPVSRRAKDVRDALERDATEAGATVLLHAGAEGVERWNEGFVVHSARGPVHCRRLLITTGGQSYPKTGTTGDGYRFAESFGHGLIEPVPALVPLVVEADWVRELSGMTIHDAAIRFLDREGAERGRSRGPLLLTHQGLSGPAGLDLGGRVARHRRRALLEIDWRPDRASETFETELRDAAKSGDRQIRRLLHGWVPERLAAAIVEAANVPIDRRVSQLRVEERRRIVQALKGTRLDVAGTLGFAKAEVTAGGVPLEEVDERTMASKIVPGLYFAGEVLDYDGQLGGYNLQAAFCTGKAAATAVASSK